MCDFIFLTHPDAAQAAQILTLYREAGWWSESDTAPDLIPRIVAGSHCFLVAVAQGRVIGMGRAIGDKVSDAYIQDVTVLKDRRQHGIGSQIVRRLRDRLQNDGCTWIGLIAEPGTQHFYQQLGFKPMPDAQPMLIGEI